MKNSSIVETIALLEQARDLIKGLESKIELERVKGERDAFRRALEACQAARQLGAGRPRPE